MKWINSGDIKNWGHTKQRHCQQKMPELVQRLILATTNDIDEIDFPSGDSIATGGWDGQLKTPSKTPFFSSGISGWEIGVEKSPGKKAEEDYNKRTLDPLGLNKQETTFIFVTPRPFPKRGKWVNEKRVSKEWKDVRVINVDRLEQWLESAPAVALWLARQIGKVITTNIRDLESFWQEWSIGTNPVMTPAIVISGRIKDCEVIQKWIANRPKVLEIQADHPDEALAFLYASIDALSETEREQIFARCVVVQNVDDFRQLISAYQTYPLVIAAPGECIDAAQAAIAIGHHVFISMDATVVGFRDVSQLSRPKREEVEKILHESGLSEADALRISKDSGRSIPVLRRQLFLSKAVSAPKWANSKSASILLPVLFANAWDENKEGDSQVLQILSSMNYETFINELSPFLSIDDSPIRKVGSVWMIKSPLDAWFLLAQHLNQNQLKLFEQSLLAVLTKTDPKYELEAKKRWAAAIYGKSSPYSEWLQTGIVESLALLAVYGNRSPSVASTQAFANNVIKEVFATANKWEAWASIKDETPLLAEAAPDTFMESVEQIIANNQTVFQELMGDDPGGVLFGECRHSGLIWALEGLAWSTEYFSRAVIVLFDLAKIDPGGRWENRPKNSLRDIFLPGRPQTHASSQERLIAMDILINKDPQLVWEFAHSYFTDGYISESHRLRWRETGGKRRGLETESVQEHQEYSEGLFQNLSDLASAKENLLSAVHIFTHLPYDIRERLINTIEGTDPASFTKEKRLKLLEYVREALHWLNNYGDKEIRTHAPGLERLLKKYTPEDVIERVGWLFSASWPQLPYKESEQDEINDANLNKARTEAARELLDNTTLEKILRFASKIQYQGVLGFFLAKAIRDQAEDQKVIDAFIEHTDDMPMLIRGYSGGRIELEGESWIDYQITRMKTKGNYSHEACALSYLGLPECADTWSAVGSHGKEVNALYWKHANGHSRKSKKDDALIAVQNLLDAKRSVAALKIAGDRYVSIPSVLLKRLLNEIISTDEKELSHGGTIEYYLGHVFKQLYQRNELPLEEIAKLELPFAEIFDKLKKYTSSPMAVHRILQNDPLFFAELITYASKRYDVAPDPTLSKIKKENANRLTLMAYEVLNSWRQIPGIQEDGTFDEKELAKWIDTARKQCAETNHLTRCDIHIGFMLAHSPVDPDGIWPHVAVRNIIERLKNKIIDKHIQNEIYNSRGVFFRGLHEGGKKERDLVKKYTGMSEALRTKWPRTAAMLKSIAESYEYEAKQWDIDSDLNELRWD